MRSRGLELLVTGLLGLLLLFGLWVFASLVLSAYLLKPGFQTLSAPPRLDNDSTRTDQSIADLPQSPQRLHGDGTAPFAIDEHRSLQLQFEEDPNDFLDPTVTFSVTLRTTKGECRVSSYFEGSTSRFLGVGSTASILEATGSHYRTEAGRALLTLGSQSCIEGQQGELLLFPCISISPAQRVFLRSMAVDLAVSESLRWRALEELARWNETPPLEKYIAELARGSREEQSRSRALLARTSQRPQDFERLRQILERTSELDEVTGIAMAAAPELRSDVKAACERLGNLDRCLTAQIECSPAPSAALWGPFCSPWREP